MAQAAAKPAKTQELHLVWNKGRNECVGFLRKGDADYAATGNRRTLEVPYATPTLADEFRECYGDEAKRLPQTTVEVAA